MENKNIAVVRCDIVSEVCSGVGCLNAFFERKAYFQNYVENARIIGFFTCGGCPGRRIPRLLKSLKKYNLQVVHLASCLLFEGDYPKCPHKGAIIEMINKNGLEVVEGTHH